MDTLVISNENHILHICNQGYTIDYTIYNSKGHNMDGGILESSKGKFESEFAIKEVISIVKDRFSFSAPYTFLSGHRAENLLELIEMEDYKNMQKKVEQLSSIKDIGDMELNI